MNSDKQLKDLERHFKARLKELAAQFEKRIQELEAENATLREKVHFLTKELERSRIKKDSQNSHHPPSQDKSLPPRRTQSRRQKSGRKSGGQKGHPGHHLEMSANPDQIHDLKSNYCCKCGMSLASAFSRLISKRQVVDIPPIRPIYKEYRQYACACANCGNEQLADYPAGVNAPIQYGGSIEAYLAYFSVYQYVPYRRLAQLFSHTFGLPISEGSISNLLKRAAKKSEGIYRHIREQIKAAAYVGSDETGAKSNGKRWWIWVWQNSQNTWLHASDNRRFETIEACFEDGLPNATVGSDRYPSQLKLQAKNHQLCLAHLDRELLFLEASEKNPWATHFKELLKMSWRHHRQMQQTHKPMKQNEKIAYRLEERLNRLLVRMIDQKNYPLTARFQRSMIKHRNSLFPFLYDLQIPPHNNGSERAIRNIKVKQKISGQFKNGQHIFCILRSVIDTLIKRGHDVFEFLYKIVTLPAT